MYNTLGKQKPNFAKGPIIIKINIERLERVLGKFIRKYFTLPINLMSIVVFMIEML